MTTQTTEEVYQFIRANYLKSKMPIAIYGIHHGVKATRKQIVSSLHSLKNDGKIIYDYANQKAIPILKEGEKEYIEPILPDMPEVQITSIRIKSCIKSFFITHHDFPKPDELSSEFLSKEGKANKASIERIAREFAEHHDTTGIFRTEDFRYYISNEELKSQGLRMFV